MLQEVHGGLGHLGIKMPEKVQKWFYWVMDLDERVDTVMCRLQPRTQGLKHKVGFSSVMLVYHLSGQLWAQLAHSLKQ